MYKYDMAGDCPKCNFSWDGGPIPEEHRHHYSPPYRWSKVIGVYDRDLDCTIGWKCPNCSHFFDYADIGNTHV